jgi:hypothetical protein
MKQIARVLIIVFIGLFSAVSGKSQEYTPPVLPNFSASIKTGKIQLDWISGFRGVKEIGIQRSLDSVINFNTIGYAASPNEMRNAYQDNKPLPGTNYYRLFILFNNGKYMYSNTVLSLPDSTIKANQIIEIEDVKGTAPTAPNEKPAEKPWHPSSYVYTTADGNINIQLPEALQKKYSIKFYDPSGVFLFEIEHVTQPFLILEKAIFHRAGWFNFELIENGKLKEKWSIFIPLNYRS